ncbi:DUF3566 domain-containing protein [Nesterenkonia muleiensis]|uniref:DUF3566 domain-containing protein n=1 Tax=Nesterenkonia muleiensis TaxID=2282648 RepID=UPI000E76A20C|nr:DUF3566 domain-containing protein [Nesterenkonia muleiensis]
MPAIKEEIATEPQTGSVASGKSAVPRPAAPRPRPSSGAQPTRPQGRPQPRPQPGARPAGGVRTGQPLVRPTPKAKVRKARLLISKVDPWSVLKMSFLLSVALGIMLVVCAVTLWSMMDLTGIFDRVNDLAQQILGADGPGGSFQLEEMVTVGQIASFATIIAVVNVVLLTVLSMLAAVLYNLSASLVGGIGVTLTDD